MLKGQTIIELTDIVSGDVKVIKEDNFITNAFRDLCQPILKNQDTIFSTAFRDEAGVTTESIFRGLLLFDKNLGENPNNYFASADTRMIGHGGAITYTGSDISLGSFNSNQSDLTSPNERMYVWDFTSEQANGIINSICLTTQVGGQIGTGSQTKSEGTTAVLKPFSNINKSKIRGVYNTTLQSPMNRMPVYLSFANDYLLLFDVARFSTGLLAFYKVDLSSRKVDVFKRFLPIQVLDASNRNLNVVGAGYTNVTEETISIPSGFSTGANFGMAQDGKYLYLTSGTASNESNESSAWAPGTSISILKIDLENLTSEVLSVTNTTGASLAIRAASSAFPYGCFTFGVSNNYLFARSWVASNGAEVADLFAINLANNTTVVKVKDRVGKEKIVGISARPNSTPFMMTIKGKIAFTDRSARPNEYTGSPSSHSMVCLVSTDSFIVEYLEASIESVFTTGMLTHFNSTYSKAFPTDNQLYYCVEDRGGEYTSTEATYNVNVYPNALMTINNLQTPIEKTASQTMRVTYKIMKE